MERFAGLTRHEVTAAAKIDRGDVEQAARKSAKKAFGEVDEKKLKGMVDRAISMAKDTKEAIGIVQGFFHEG